ncbi:FMN-binding negative transcriptional regulator [Aquirufa aurantiipilula]|jgi:transcriptional regulator|uniref:FMN-binding negative transcriptional regulator n=1 Tax=Aquirufa aurantiipilula TaxID=2696561 RepID=UPI001CAA75FE|nr:FMN-binding negative transcriptional regulator [Aquirufa aurantiipilula]MBZ1326265.1 FMN-binding negative transcriptional regulator [Aquirufa aurantiipilula]
MYIQPINQVTDLGEIVDFIQRFSFGTIISVVNGRQVATHLPFISHLNNNKIVLRAHFAKANEQWKHLEAQESLVIFQEPHAYISPKYYEKEQNVPTWNYMTVHLYGQARLIETLEETKAILEESINFFEQEYKKQWDGLSEAYKLNMMQGIVAFDMEISEIQAKKKISQNRSEKEKAQIAQALSQSTSTHEQLIGEYMKK